MSIHWYQNTFTLLRQSFADNHSQRDLLWSQAPYPCIGEFKFLTLNLPSHPSYPAILSQLQPSPLQPHAEQPKLLDLGCCVGQELRSLAHARIPSSNLYGSDLNPKFLETSYDLFRDRDTFQATLVPANALSPTLFEKEFAGWQGKFSVVHAGLFLHLFDWEKQVDVSQNIVKLMKQEKGSLFVGEMVGCQGGGVRSSGKDSKFWEKGQERKQFLHDEKTFVDLWDEVAQKTSTVGQWRVDAKFTLRDPRRADGSAKCAFFVGEGVGWLTFSVERL